MTLPRTDEIPLVKVQNILKTLNSYGSGKGFEFHTFKTGWYNAKVGSKFHLPYNKDTVAFIVISQPKMFENAFIPYIKKMWTETFNESMGKVSLNELHPIDSNDIDVIVDHSDPRILNSLLHKLKRDPLDQCMQFQFNQFTALLPESEFDIIHDYEMTPLRRPKILVQTAGYVAGAVNMYRREDLGSFNDSQNAITSLEQSCNEDSLKQVDIDPWPSEQKIFPVCLHPEFGGWFALRGVLVMKHSVCRELDQKPPKSILQTRDEVSNLLKLYNFHWQDDCFRDVITVNEKYSAVQIKYFSTAPKDRNSLLYDLCNSYT